MRNAAVLLFLSIAVFSSMFAGAPIKADNFTLPDCNGIETLAHRFQQVQSRRVDVHCHTVSRFERV